MKRNLCLALVAVVALSAPAFAASNSNNKTSGNQSGTGEIGFALGQSDVSSDAAGIDSAQSLQVRGGYNVNSQWQVEGQFVDASDSGDVSGVNVDTDMKLLMVNGVMNFHPRKKEFVPYVMAGIGRADVSVDASGLGSTSDNSMAYQIGGGTRIFFGKSKTMAFRTDVSLLKQNTFSESNTLTTLTAGITWKLGGR